MNKVFAVVLRHDNGTVTLRAGARDAQEAQRMVLNAEHAPESAVLEVYRWFGDMTEVRQAVTAGGSHWFDKDTMRFFGTRLSRDLYAGRYFVTSEQNPSGVRRYSVRKVVCENGAWAVETVGGFAGFHSYASRNGAHAAAQKISCPSLDMDRK